MAPGNSNDPLRVVRTKGGTGTGETLYQTEDGRWWREVSRSECASTWVGERRFLDRCHLWRKQ